MIIAATALETGRVLVTGKHGSLHVDCRTDAARLAKCVVIIEGARDSIDRDATAFRTEADETMAFGNGDLILIEDATFAPPIIMEIVCNRTGEHNRRWL